jgi:hypothetical protein
MINEEYLTGNGLIAYPFKETSLGLTGDEKSSTDSWAAGEIPRDAIVDFFMFVNSDPEYLSLTYIARSGTEMTLRFTDTSSVDIFEASFDLSSLVEYQALVLFQDLVDPDLLDITGAMTVGPGLLTFPDLTTISFDVGDVILLESTTPTKTNPITQLNVDAVTDVNDDGIITIKEGYNIEINAAVGDDEDTTELTIIAGPGLGEGRVPPEAQVSPTYLTSLNDVVKANADGAVNIAQADDCHRFIAMPNSNSIAIHNDCDPCCDCADYAGPVTVMDGQWEELEALRIRLYAAIDLYNTHVLLWNNELLPNIRKVYVSGVAIKSFIADRNKHTISASVINQGPSVAGRFIITLPDNTEEVLKAVLESDKESPRKCADREEDAPDPVITGPHINEEEVRAFFKPLCYCTTAQILIVLRMPVATDPSENVTISFVADEGDEVLATKVLQWK